MKTLIKNIGLIVSGDIERPLVEGDSIAIADGRIVAVGKGLEDQADTVIDAKGSAVIPGLLGPRARVLYVEYECSLSAILAVVAVRLKATVAAAAFIFQQTLFFGYRLIGNSDRLNHYLSFILFHTHNLEQGHFAAWSDFIYDGFDTLALPMSFITPLYALPALLHNDDVVSIFGFIAFILLAITLFETYFVVYVFTHDRLASLAGACTYGCATYGLLKLVQSDQTYLSVLTAPAFFYLIHTASTRNWSSARSWSSSAQAARSRRRTSGRSRSGR